jgi:hypothetical protein
MPNGSFRNTTWRGTAATKRGIYFASAGSVATRIGNKSPALPGADFFTGKLFVTDDGSTF